MSKVICGKFCITGKCKRKRECACKVCGPLEAINPNLAEGCIAECNGGNRPQSTEDYLCNRVGGDVLLSLYGIQRCGHSFIDTPEAQAAIFAENMEADNKKMVKYGIIGIAAIVIIGLFSLLLKD